MTVEERTLEATRLYQPFRVWYNRDSGISQLQDLRGGSYSVQLACGSMVLPF